MKELTEQQLKDKPNLELRLAALQDRNLVASGLKISNLLLYFNENIVANDDREEAEKLMSQLEQVDEDQAELRLQFKLDDIRRQRDRILAATDWLFISDVPTPQKDRRIYMQYRQYLRDITSDMKRSPDTVKVEDFEHFLRRKYPEEFMDGGRNKVIIHRFTYYYRS